MSEEELQRRIETGAQITGKDGLAYRKVFDALEREPDFRLPVNFADAVMDRVKSKQESRKEYFLIGGGVLFFVIAATVTCFMTDFRLSSDAFRLQTGIGAYQFVKDYSGLFIFGAGFIIALQWLDKRFIKSTAKRVSDFGV
jgi:hypothetical protein